MIILKKGCTHKVFSCHTFIFIDKDVSHNQCCPKLYAVSRLEAFVLKELFKRQNHEFQSFWNSIHLVVTNNPRMPPWQINEGLLLGNPHTFGACEGFREAEWPSCFAGPWTQQFEAGRF